MSTPSGPLPPYPPHPPDKSHVEAERRERTRWRITWLLVGVSVLAIGACALWIFLPRTTPMARLSADHCVDDARKGAEAMANGDRPDGLRIVACFEAHDGLIYATGRVPDDVASDAAAALRYAEEFCRGRLPTPTDSEMAAFAPNADDLADGDRAVVCVSVNAVAGS